MLPLSYTLRSLFVRRSSTLLTVLGIGATVAVVSGVLALRQGFTTLFSSAGREDVVLFLRPGATTEGDSRFRRQLGDQLVKGVPEIAADGEGRPLAAMECYLAILREKIGGGKTNVAVRGVQPQSFSVHDEVFRLVDGERFKPGADEVIVGENLTSRIRNCRKGDVLVVNTTPFRVVGVFASDGPFGSEIWGDLERMTVALDIDPNRVVAKLRPGTDVEALADRLEEHKVYPARVVTERDYLEAQTSALSATLLVLGGILATIMGLAAVFTATNTMLAAIASRTHEIGILLSTGFRPKAIFLSFLLESVLLGLIGGGVGCLLALPLNGVQTGATNFNTFTEVAFAFRVTPGVLVDAVTFALVLGLLGGAFPAWRAAGMKPIEALRRA